jgi:hypothetical protein
VSFADADTLAEFANDDSLRSLRGDLLVENASALIRTYCQQTFDRVVDDLVELRGTSSERLMLPERPVIEVTSVYLDGFEVDDWSRVRDRLWRSGGWGGPSSSVEVSYTHGFAPNSPTMLTLRSICLSVAYRMSVNPATATQQTIGDFNQSFAAGALTAAEQAMLDRYRHEYATA